MPGRDEALHEAESSSMKTDRRTASARSATRMTNDVVAGLARKFQEKNGQAVVEAQRKDWYYGRGVQWTSPHSSIARER
jgi:hypothetical protein